MSDSAFVNLMTKPIVLFIGGGLLAVAIGLDIWLAVDRVPDNTWSELLRKGALATPVIPWACAVLMGHWFHPNDGAQPVLGQPKSIPLLVWLTWMVFIVGLGLTSLGLVVSPWIPAVPGMIAGWCYGRFEVDVCYQERKITWLTYCHVRTTDKGVRNDWPESCDHHRPHHSGRPDVYVVYSLIPGCLDGPLVPSRR